MPIEFKTESEVATIVLNEEISEDSALKLRELMKSAHEYWKYDKLKLEINSPGGDLIALTAIVEELQRWRSHGKVQTVGLLRVASAAAVALTIGDIGGRSVHRYTQLVYHHSRFVTPGQSAFTAQKAVHAARQLGSADEMVLDMVVDHLVGGLGSVTKVGSTGLNRCAVLRACKDASGRGSLANMGRGLQVIERAYEKARDRDDLKPYRKLLVQLFDRDQPMDLDLAWALQLIDEVTGSNILTPDIAALASRRSSSLALAA